MKITIDIPDWVEDRHIYIMAGVELVAYKFLNQAWMVKTGQCHFCGKCCEGWRDTDDFPKSENGRCVYLQNDGEKKMCSLGANRPFACSVAMNRKPGCTQIFEVVEDQNGNS